MQELNYRNQFNTQFQCVAKSELGKFSFNSLNDKIIVVDNDLSLINNMPLFTANAVEFYENEKLIAGGVNGYLNIYDINTPSLLNSINFGSEIKSLKYLYKKYLVIGSYLNSIKIYDVSKWLQSYSLDGHTGAVLCMEQLSENILASGSVDKNIILWDIQNWNLIKVLSGSGFPVKTIKLLGYFTSSTTTTTTTSTSLDFTTTTTTTTTTTGYLASTTTSNTTKKISNLRITSMTIQSFFQVIKNQNLSNLMNSYLIRSVILNRKLFCLNLCSNDISCKITVYKHNEKFCNIYSAINNQTVFNNEIGSNVFLKL